MTMAMRDVASYGHNNSQLAAESKSRKEEQEEHRSTIAFPASPPRRPEVHSQSQLQQQQQQHRNPRTCRTGQRLRPSSVKTHLLVCFVLLTATTVSAFGITTPTTLMAVATAAARKSRGGGRAPSQEDKVTNVVDEYAADDDGIDGQEDGVAEGRAAMPRAAISRPPLPTESRLIVLQVTDVYTLENFASFKTLIEETKRQNPGAKVVSMLTGDFLSPYLLSGIDRGNGMMNALNKLPLDYLTWGNHEADIDHRTVCRHVRNFRGTWINSNMLDHDEMKHQKEYEVIEIPSPDGKQTRKVGLIAVLSNDPALYAHFKAPGAFGGATISDPWDTLRKYKSILEADPNNCDMIIPLQHLYVPDDEITCKTFDFPIVLSGHDHHRVDQVVEGTRLLKPGMNAVYATMLEISWRTQEDVKPRIRAKFVPCGDWPANKALEEENDRAYDVLEPLRNTELARVPPQYEPLSSNGSRGGVCTMGKYICSLIRSSMNVSRRQRQLKVDAVMLMGGNVRGNADYPSGSFFSLEALEAEIKPDEVLAVIPMPGWLLQQGVAATHAGDPIPGWMQYDQGITEDFENNVITHVSGAPIDLDRVYRVATKISDLTNGQSPPWTEYYKEHPEHLPPKGAYVNVHAELMAYFARNLWRKLWDAVTDELDEADNAVASEEKVDMYGPKRRMDVLDLDGDGIVSVEEIQHALKELLDISVDDRELSLAEFVHSFADTTGDGQVSLGDFVKFCEEMDETYERDKWRLQYKKEKVAKKKKKGTDASSSSSKSPVTTG
mmetsp:Transcript_22988/g.65143  ORF Transcript_22988/g.65143 Transcript_22988/m.65143 type:complete len:778 (-) Transcript_22988:59-2392(-)